MQAKDDGGAGAGGAGGADGAAGGAKGQDGPGGPGDPGVAGQAGAAVGGVPQMEQAPHASGPGGDAAPEAGGPRRRLFEFTFTVPFPSPLEAEAAQQFLTSQAQLPGPVRKELTVTGRALTVRLSAEDPGLLRTSVISCIDQLSLLVRIIQRCVYLSFVQPYMDNRG